MTLCSFTLIRSPYLYGIYIFVSHHITSKHSPFCFTATKSCKFIISMNYPNSYIAIGPSKVLQSLLYINLRNQFSICSSPKCLRGRFFFHIFLHYSFKINFAKSASVHFVTYYPFLFSQLSFLIL